MKKDQQRSKPAKARTTPARPKSAPKTLDARQADRVKGGAGPSRWTKGGGSSVG